MMQKKNKLQPVVRNKNEANGTPNHHCVKPLQKSRQINKDVYTSWVTLKEYLAWEIAMKKYVYSKHEMLRKQQNKKAPKAMILIT